MAAPIDQRLAAAAPRLRRQIERLYGAAHDADALWRATEALLRARAAERSPALTALDAARLGDPGWFAAPEMLGYSAYVDRLGGTLAGVAARIGHLQALGVRYLHLLALLKMREGESDGGFAVADYLAVEPRLGSMADLAALAARLRAGGISLCVDLALNHTADDHRWARAACAGDPHFRDFYIVVDAAEARAREAELPQVFPQSAPGNFTPVPAMGGWVRTTFYPFQWDLNWRNPQVFLAMLDVMLRLANHGVEAFRLDSIAFLWKEPGTDCRNLPQAHYIVRALRAALDIAAPATLLKAEAIVPTAFVPAYFGGDEGAGWEAECQLVYHNSLMVAGWAALAEQSAALPAAVLDALAPPPPGGAWLSYARCHDDIGWGALLGEAAAIDPDPHARLARAAAFLEGRTPGSWARGAPFQSEGGSLHGTNGSLAALAGLEAARDAASRAAALDRIMLLHALAIASGGLPTLYMGDEFGLLNDPGYRRDPGRAHDGRWLHRPAMDWAAASAPEAQRITADLARLRAARVASGGRGAATRLPGLPPALLGLACGADRVFLNFSAESVMLPPLPGWRDRLGGDGVALGPWQVGWMGM